MHTSDGYALTKDNLIESYALSFTYGSNAGIRVTTQKEGGAVGDNLLLSEAKCRLADLVGGVKAQLKDLKEHILPLPCTSNSVKDDTRGYLLLIGIPQHNIVSI